MKKRCLLFRLKSFEGSFFKSFPQINLYPVVMKFKNFIVENSLRICYNIVNFSKYRDKGNNSNDM